MTAQATAAYRLPLVNILLFPSFSIFVIRGQFRQPASTLAHSDRKPLDPS